MANRNAYQALEHDNIVRASARTYTSLVSKGYNVTTNLTGETNRFVGDPSNPMYPDVIVWKPNYVGASKGVATIIEEIETSESVSLEEANRQWVKYGLSGVNKFILIVPFGYQDIALNIIRQSGAKVNELWIYQFDRINGNISFSNSNLI